MFNFRNATSPAEMHARADTALRESPSVEYNAEYQVEAATMVNELVPTKNRTALECDDWIRRIVSYYASVEVVGHDMNDPLLIVARQDKAYDLDASHPASPVMSQCAHCQTWSVEYFKGNLGATAEPVAVGRVRFARGARVIELLLCVPCIVRLDVEMS